MDHTLRRNTILKKYPNIKHFFKIDSRSKYICICLVFLQLCFSVIVPKFTNIYYWLFSYIFGATLTQAIFLSIHELSHNLFFKLYANNKLFSIFANLPIVFPFAISFRYYHLLHHSNIGEVGLDSDIPTKTEVKIFRGMLMRFLFVFFQILAYAIRPMILLKQPINMYLIINIIVQFSFNWFWYYNFGISAIKYLLLCVFVAGGLHPTSAHFIAEHYTVSEQETFSYYGFFNRFMWNVGFHVEHHDFQNITWSNLPRIKEIAPEFYENLEVHTSYVKVLYDFVKSGSLSNRKLKTS